MQNFFDENPPKALPLQVIIKCQNLMSPWLLKFHFHFFEKRKKLSSKTDLSSCRLCCCLNFDISNNLHASHIWVLFSVDSFFANLTVMFISMLQTAQLCPCANSKQETVVFFLINNYYFLHVNILLILLIPFFSVNSGVKCCQYLKNIY